MLLDQVQHCCLVTKSCIILLRPHRLQPAKLFCPLYFPDKNTGVGCHFLLQGIFTTQRSNLHFLHCHMGSLPLSLPGKQEAQCYQDHTELWYLSLNFPLLTNILSPHPSLSLCVHPFCHIHVICRECLFSRPVLLQHFEQFGKKFL